MGYDGGLFDDEEEIFWRVSIAKQLSIQALYLLAFVEPLDNEP